MSADLTAPPPMPEPAYFLDELLNGGEPHGVMLGCDKRDVAEKAHTPGETTGDIKEVYTAEQIAARDAIWSERIAALLRAVPPLPVVAERWRFTAETAKDRTWRHCESVPNFDPAIVEADPLVRKSDADAAIAALTARAEAAERDAARGRRALGALMAWLSHNLPMDVWIQGRQKDEWKAAESVLRDYLKPMPAIDAAMGDASQEQR